MLDKIQISELQDGLKISNIMIRDAHELNVFDKIEKITWLEFTVTNSGIRDLGYIEAFITYIGKGNEHLGHEETRGSSSLKMKNKVLMRIPFDFPENADKAKLYLNSYKLSWPYKMARIVDKIWVFLKN